MSKFVTLSTELINSALLKKNAVVDCRNSGPDKERGPGSDCAYAQSDPEPLSLLGYALVIGTLYHVPKGAVDRGLISMFGNFPWCCQ